LLRRESFTRWAEVKETADEYTCLCDYDGRLPADLRQRVRAVRRLLGLRTVYRRLDRTARGFHMVLRWDTALTPTEIIAVQAILGSDPMREAMNLMRVRAKPGGMVERQFWNLLYSQKHF
jgi:hypothetical protein